MIKILKIFIILFFCFLIFSCHKQSPQLPSNKGVEKDQNGESLLAINENLAIKEDGLLRKFALQQKKTFKRSDLGFWYRIDQPGNGTKITDSVSCRVSYRLLSLDGKELERDVKQVIIGKKQVVTGLEEGLKLLKKGDSATFIIPWYLAFGMKGNEPIIPGYTSIVYRIKVFN